MQFYRQQNVIPFTMCGVRLPPSSKPRLSRPTVSWEQFHVVSLLSFVVYIARVRVLFSLSALVRISHRRTPVPRLLQDSSGFDDYVWAISQISAYDEATEVFTSQPICLVLITDVEFPTDPTLKGKWACECLA